jgi:hypothetical protein
VAHPEVVVDALLVVLGDGVGSLWGEGRDWHGKTSRGGSMSDLIIANISISRAGSLDIPSGLTWEWTGYQSMRIAVDEHTFSPLQI